MTRSTASPAASSDDAAPGGMPPGAAHSGIPEEGLADPVLAAAEEAAPLPPGGGRRGGSSRRAALLPYVYLLATAVQGMAAVVVQPFSIHVFGSVRSPGWESTAFGISIMQIGLVVFSAGFPLAITRAWLDPENGPTKARAINGFNDLLAFGGGGLLAGIMAVAGAPAYLVAAAWAMGMLAAVVAAQAQLRAQDRPFMFSLLAAGSSVLAHLFGLTSIVLLGATAAHFMAGFALATTLTALAAMLVTRPTLPSRAWDAVKTATRAALPLLPHSLAIILLLQGDSMILKRLAPAGDTGVYLAANVFALGPVAVIAGLNNSWSAAVLRASHRGAEEFSEAARKTLHTATGLGVVMALAGAIFAPLGIMVLAQGNPQTTQVAIVLPVVGIGYGLYIVATNVLFGRLDTKAFYWVTPSVVVVAALAAWIPAATGSLAAVALVKVLAFLLLGLVYSLVARRHVRLPMLRSLLLAGLALAVAGGMLALDAAFLH